jgi:CMP-N,N'-diacetyllegionaminic acid synthase
MKPAIVIPARAGSKGVHKKNLRLVANQPLIYWTIIAALESCVTDQVFVSSDDPDIRFLAKSLGVKAVERPASLASDDTPMVDVITDLLLNSKSFVDIDSVILLQPTSPFRLSRDISACWDIFVNGGRTDSVFSVYAVEDVHPSRMYTLSNGRLVPFDMSNSRLNRQKLTRLYHRNGCVYISSRKTILSGLMWSESIIPYEMPADRSLNIDSPFDLLIADLLMQHLLSK